MKPIRGLFLSFFMVLLSTPLVYAQDFSRYRSFSFGMSVAAVEAQLAPQELKTKLIHAPPVMIQELTWWPQESQDSAMKQDSVWQVLFTFYDGRLYRMLVTYERKATDGFTDEDVIRAVSAHYGAASHPNLEISFPTNELYRSTETVIARWEDPQYSFNLFRSSYLNLYGLVMFSKEADAKVRFVLANLAKPRMKEDPQKEIDREERIARDLETARERNRKIFRP